MKHLTLLLTALMAGLALSGCVGDDSNEPSDAGPTTTPTSTGDAGNNTTMPEPPEASFTLTIDGNATEAVNGTVEAPAAANLTFDASASTGENLSFAWDLGDGNTTTESVVNYTYGVAGNYTVVLTVTDSAGQTNETDLVVRVTEAADAASGTIQESFSGTIILGTQGDSGCGLTGVVDVASHTWTIPASAKHLLLAMTLEATALDVDFFLVDPAGETIGSGTDFNVLSGPTETIDVTGSFPAGDYTIEVVGCTAVAGEYSIDATAELGA